MHEDASQTQVEDKFSLKDLRLTGACLIPAGLVLGYFAMYQPLADALHKGSAHFYFKAVVFPPAMIYVGLFLLLTDMRDSKTRYVGADGKTHPNRKGKTFAWGLGLVIIASGLGWLALMHALGLQEGV